MTMPVTSNECYGTMQNVQKSRESVFAAYKRLTGNAIDRQSVHSVVFTGESGEISGMALFCDYTGNSVSIHLHMPKQLTRKTIKKIFNYAFTNLGVINLFAEIKSSNRAVLDVAERIGFREIARVDKFYGNNWYDDSKIILIATENDVAKWIN